MSFVSVRNIQIHYHISGTGADLRNEPNIFDSLLADQFELLAFDQRGLGQTDRPDIAYTMEDYANDAAELLKAVGWQYCHVMGVSFGGMVAQVGTSTPIMSYRIYPRMRRIHCHWHSMIVDMILSGRKKIVCAMKGW